MKALWMQCKIEILRTFRNKLFIFFSLLMPVMFYYIFTNVIQVPQNGDAWKAHYLISMATFSIVGTALFSFGVRISQEKGQGWTHLLKITPLPEGAYLTAKIIAQTVVNAFSILVIFIAGILINHVELTVGQWIGAGLWLLLGVTPFLALGTVIGSIKKADAAAGLANILNMSLAVIGGLWMPIEVFPKILRTIGEWTPTYHFGSGAWDIVAGKSIGWENIAVLGGYFFFFIFIFFSIYIIHLSIFFFLPFSIDIFLKPFNFFPYVVIFFSLISSFLFCAEDVYFLGMYSNDTHLFIFRILQRFYDIFWFFHSKCDGICTK